MAVLSLLLVVSAGCHSMHFTLRAEPTDQTVQQWNHFFLWGLVPTREIDAKAYCPHGVVAVDEEETIPDGLINIATIGIWTPRTATLACRGESSGEGGR